MERGDVRDGKRETHFTRHETAGIACVPSEEAICNITVIQSGCEFQRHLSGDEALHPLIHPLDTYQSGGCLYFKFNCKPDKDNDLPGSHLPGNAQVRNSTIAQSVSLQN